MKVLVIGDSCIDEFIYCDIERICPEAPVPVLKPTHKTENGGMASNVVANLEALGCEIQLISNTNGIRKVRYVDSRSNQLVVRVDEHDYCDRISLDDLNYISQFSDEYDAVIISDYCKGFLAEDDIKYICEECENVFIDTKKQLGDWVRGVDLKEPEFSESEADEFIQGNPTIQDFLYNDEFAVEEMAEQRKKNPFDEKVANALANGEVEMSVKKNIQ